MREPCPDCRRLTSSAPDPCPDCQNERRHALREEMLKEERQVKAVYRNEYYKDLRRWLILRHEADKHKISDAEFLELSSDAVAEFQYTLKEGR
jgi:recombinational DNA repair protein RecR